MALTVRQFKFLCFAARESRAGEKRSLEIFHCLSNLRHGDAPRDTRDTAAIHFQVSTIPRGQV
jgi:hypothetical protein